MLEAGWRLMREDPNRATMARIAGEAGVSRQAAYLHFGSRAGLLLALVRWVDERERVFEQFAALSDGNDPWNVLEAYVTLWLDYLPRLHPVPGFLARAKEDSAARNAWKDRMLELEALYRTPIKALRRAGALRKGLTTEQGVELVRAVASVHAWEQLVHDQGWSQNRAVQSLWLAVRGALARSAQPHSASACPPGLAKTG